MQMIQELHETMPMELLQSTIWLLRKQFLYFQIRFVPGDANATEFQGVTQQTFDGMSPAQKPLTQFDIDHDQKFILEIFKKGKRDGVCVTLMFTMARDKMEEMEPLVNLFLRQTSSIRLPWPKKQTKETSK